MENQEIWKNKKNGERKTKKWEKKPDQEKKIRSFKYYFPKILFSKKKTGTGGNGKGDGDRKGKGT